MPSGADGAGGFRTPDETSRNVSSAPAAGNRHCFVCRPIALSSALSQSLLTVIPKGYFRCAEPAATTAHMRNEQHIQHTEAANSAMPLRKISPFLQLGEGRACVRKVRIVLPRQPRRGSCVTRRAIIAAMRAAELAEWEASGGDYLARGPMHQPVHNAQI
jgi:hypothetical protein